MELRTGIAALAAAGLSLTACTSADAPEPSASGIPSADAAGSLRVWLMDSSQPQTVVDAVNDAFGKAYPNVEVTVERQQWTDIQARLLAALGDQAPPDVVEIGNVLAARFADAGLLAPLDPAAFGVAGMLPGLQPYGELNGVRYGIPYYGGVKSVVVYKKSDFEKADVGVPGTLAELRAAAESLQAANAENGEYSAFYFPGRYWYGALPFVWEAGGDIAVQDDDTWIGTLDSVESRAGLSALKDLVDKYSKAPTNGNENKNTEAFMTGNVGMMIDSWWAPGALSVGELAGDVGAFAIPGTAEGTTAPVFVAGSDLAVSQGSANKALAVEWMKILTGVEVQTLLAKQGVTPNQEGAFAGHEGNPFLQLADEAALVSKALPVSPNWGNVESLAILPDMLEKILSGEQSVEEATAAASESIAATLNG